MPPMTSQTTCSSPLTAVSPALLFLASLLLAHVHPTTSSLPSSPIQLQRRQSFFRCTGWGAGCSNLDYSYREPGYTRAEPRRYQEAARVVRPSRVRTSGASSAGGSRGFRHGNYGLHFLFTSGTSWGANGKRSVDVRPTYSDVKTQRLHNIIAGASWGANKKRSIDGRSTYSDVKTQRLHNIITGLYERLALEHHK
ncbi:uncharacterized protein [Littorina saxatilis]|uniref:uncharacterized protein n=1 Tax=Littorina saxatilis TaxID=31220 RepID=UPI0038B45BD5